MRVVLNCIEDLGGGVMSSLIGSPELPRLHVLSTLSTGGVMASLLFVFFLSEKFNFQCGFITARRCVVLYMHGWCVSDGACYMNAEGDRQHGI